MPAAYSDDLRHRVLAGLARGEKKSQEIQMFGVSRDSIDRWLHQREHYGQTSAKKGYQKGHTHALSEAEEEAFRVFVRENGGKTLKEMVQLWHKSISTRTLSRALARRKITRKKRLTGTKSAPEKNGNNF